MSKHISKKRALERKKCLIYELQEIRQAIIAEANNIPAGLYDEVFLGIWSLKDLLAHLAGWDKTNIRASKEILEGKLPSFYSHYDKDWASYNEMLVKDHKRQEPETMVEYVETTHRELIEFLEDLPAEEFYRDRGIRAGRYKVLVGRLVEAERDDEGKHLEQIRSFRESIDR